MTLAARGFGLAPVSALVTAPAATAECRRQTREDAWQADPAGAAVSAECRRGAVQPAGRCSSPAAPICRTPRARPAAGNCRRAASTPARTRARAVLRELAEEIGTDRAEIIGEHPEWLTYDLPPDADRRGAGGPFSRPAAALVRAALHRRGRRHPARPRSAPGVRRLALGRTGRAAGAGGAISSGRSTRCWQRLSHRSQPALSSILTIAG